MCSYYLDGEPALVRDECGMIYLNFDVALMQFSSFSEGPQARCFLIRGL